MDFFFLLKFNPLLRQILSTASPLQIPLAITLDLEDSLAVTFEDSFAVTFEEFLCCYLSGFPLLLPLRIPFIVDPLSQQFCRFFSHDL